MKTKHILKIISLAAIYYNKILQSILWYILVIRAKSAKTKHFHGKRKDKTKEIPTCKHECPLNHILIKDRQQPLRFHITVYSFLDHFRSVLPFWSKPLILIIQSCLTFVGQTMEQLWHISGWVHSVQPLLHITEPLFGSPNTYKQCVLCMFMHHHRLFIFFAQTSSSCNMDHLKVDKKNKNKFDNHLQRLIRGGAKHFALCLRSQGEIRRQRAATPVRLALHVNAAIRLFTLETPR